MCRVIGITKFIISSSIESRWVNFPYAPYYQCFCINDISIIVFGTSLIIV